MTDPFVPPRCPNRLCHKHRSPTPNFYWHRGAYIVACRAEPIPRFRCKSCRRSFSRQTFRLDRWDKRPDRNVELFLLLTSGVGLRQCARTLGMGTAAVQQKFRKLARNLRLLNRNLLRQLPPNRCYLLDEIETFEQKSICPLTVPVLIEKESLAVIATDSAPIRRMTRRGSQRQRWMERQEKKHGRRKDHGRRCVRKIFGRFQRLLAGQKALLITDDKAIYRTLCRRLMGDRVQHLTYSSKLARTTFNPLFPINLTEAMLRDNLGRLRRRSWLVSKRGNRLSLQLEMFVAYRNWLRPRTNQGDPNLCPGMVLGIVLRRLEVDELLAWRQDWREYSIHPASSSAAETVRQQVA